MRRNAMTPKRILLTNLIICFVLTFFGLAAAQAADTLPSWNDGKAKQSIIEFVTRVTKEGSSDFVPVEELQAMATIHGDETVAPDAWLD